MLDSDFEPAKATLPWEDLKDSAFMTHPIQVCGLPSVTGVNWITGHVVLPVLDSLYSWRYTGVPLGF